MNVRFKLVRKPAQKSKAATIMNQAVQFLERVLIFTNFQMILGPFIYVRIWMNNSVKRTQINVNTTFLRIQIPKLEFAPTISKKEETKPRLINASYYRKFSAIKQMGANTTSQRMWIPNLEHVLTRSPTSRTKRSWINVNPI